MLQQENQTQEQQGQSNAPAEQRDPNLQYVFYEPTQETLAFPKDMSDDEMAAILSDYTISTIPQEAPAATPEGRFDWWELGSEMGLTVAGGVAGQRLTQGAPAPVQFIGTTLGAAGGTALHFLGQDFREGEQLDYERAVKEALVSAGLDVATLGAQRLLPDRAWLKMMNKMGIDPTKTASSIIADIGSSESVEQAQAFLASKGLGLLPSQTKVQNAWFSRLKEKVGRLGFTSRGSFEDYAEAVNSAVREEIESVFKLTDNISVSAVADNFDLVYRTAQSALSEQYATNLDRLIARAKPNFTNANPLRTKLSQILQKNNITGLRADGTLDVFDSELQEETKAFLNKNFAKLMDEDNPFIGFDAKSIIQLEKQATAAQKAALDGQKTTAANEIKAISYELKEAYATMLERIDPKLASEYRGIKERYRKGMEDMFPELSGDKLKKALDNGTMYPIARSLVTSKAMSARQTKELMMGITRTYSRLRYTNPKNYKQILKDQGLPESPNEFKKQLRQSFLVENFGDMLTGDNKFTASNVAKIKNLFRGESDERVKVLFGEQYKDLKRMLGVIDVVSRDARGNIADLASLSKQYEAAGNIFTVLTSAIGGTAAYSANPQVVALSAAILLTPHYLAKSVMKPEVGNRLLKLSKTKFEDFKKRADIVNLAASEFLQDLTEPEMLELSEYLEALTTENQRQALVEQTKAERVY